MKENNNQNVNIRHVVAKIAKKQHFLGKFFTFFFLV